MDGIVTILPMIVAALGSAGVVKLIDFWIERRRVKLKKKDDFENGVYVTKQQFDEFQMEIKKNNDELKSMFSEKMDIIKDAQKISMRARINQMGTEYIKQGWITSQNLEIIIEMHCAYHKLGGNGHLDSVMEQVKQLPIK